MSDEQDGDSQRDKKKEKSRRPGNTAFKQQRLKAWQPILTPKTVLPLFFAIGIVFAPIGGLLLWASEQVQEIVIDYTHCADPGVGSTDLSLIPSSNVQANFYKPVVETSQPAQWKYSTNSTIMAGGNVTYSICTLQFQIEADMHPPVLLYYRLTNFYQNHRRYVKSVNEDQLRGKAASKGAVDTTDSCSPLGFDNDTGKIIYPCGLMANSLFNDTFGSPVLIQKKAGTSSEGEIFNMTNKGISWSTDRDRYGPTQYNLSIIQPPPNWIDKFGTAYNETTVPNLQDWEEFQVWMRTAGLPTFSKLARRNDTTIMTNGVYQLDINMSFPVTEYGGTKSIVLSTRTAMGGKNPFLGIAYVIVGGLCVLLGVIFTARHLFKPRKLGDHTYLSWENGPAVATSSGRDLQGSGS